MARYIISEPVGDLIADRAHAIEPVPAAGTLTGVGRDELIAPYLLAVLGR